jgi:hypothetical protein
MNDCKLLPRIRARRAGWIGLLTMLCLCSFLEVSASGQSSHPPAGGTNLVQGRPEPTDAWSRVLQIAPNTPLRVSASKHGGNCIFQSATASGIVCLHGSKTREVQREDIKSIKLARRGRSTGLGLAIGAGAGAGIGAGVGSAINSSDTGSYLHVSGGKSAGVGAGVGVIVGGAAGALVGYSTDFFSGPVIYKR